MEFKYGDGGRAKYFVGHCGDCATRAIAIATGMDYKEVYKRLGKIAGKSVRNGRPKDADRKLMKELGWTWHPTMASDQGCRVHLSAEDLPGAPSCARSAGTWSA